MLCCGDFYQHTLIQAMTATLIQRRIDDITRYEARTSTQQVSRLTGTRSTEHGVAQLQCAEFITGQLNIRIAAHGRHATLIETITDAERTAALHADNTVIKLFYREHHRYGCYSMNWGVSKGLDHFKDICVVMGSSHWKLLTRQELAALPPSSRNRLYVAILTGARQHLFCSQKLICADSEIELAAASPVGLFEIKLYGQRRHFRLEKCGSGFGIFGSAMDK